MDLKHAFVILIYLPYNLCLLKEWAFHWKFSDPTRWSPNKIPCENDTLIFPKKVGAEIIIDIPKITAKEIVWPVNGDVEFRDSDYEIEFQGTEGSFSDASCKGEDVKLNDVPIKSWYDIDSWKITSFSKEEIKSGEGGEAVPHTDRIPCYNDDVAINEVHSYVMLAPTTDIKIKHFFFHKSTVTGGNILRFLAEIFDTNIIITERSARVTLSPEDQGDLEICQETVPDILICETFSCPQPACVNPVKPKRGCCYTCGGLITVQIPPHFDLQSFRKRTAQWIVSEKLKDDVSPIQWWVGPIKKLRKHRLQIVILDKNRYTGISSDFVEDFKNFISDEYSSEMRITEITKSGLPIDNGIGGMMLALVTLLSVVLFFIGFILYYYGPQVARKATNSFDFARFENRSREGSLAFGISQSQISLAKSFENPLYGSKRKPKEEFEVKEVPLNDTDDEEDDELNKKLETAFED